MTNIIELIKNKNIKELNNTIIQNKKIDLNVKDNHYNYFIYFVLLYNLEDTLDLILKREIRLDILDSDGRNILYIPIKFSYDSMLTKILIHDAKNIGINIIDIKDKLGLTAIQYTIIFNNSKAFDILLKYNPNLMINNNQGLNIFHIAIQYNRPELFIKLLNSVTDLHFFTQEKETLLQYAIINDRFDFINYILKRKINIDNQDDLNGLTALHQIIIKNNLDIVRLLINNGANINIQDFYGNTCLHYAISEKNIEIIKLILKYNTIYNITNIDGNTALHMYLDNDGIAGNEQKSNNHYINKDILETLIINTDLNIQNNHGITCLKKIIDLDLFHKYATILKDKELNFFIEDNNDEDMSNSLNDEKIFEIAIESYYLNLIKKEDNLIEDWEKWCSKSLIDKLKTLKPNMKLDSKEICKAKIKDVILTEKRSIPKFSKLNLILDNGIFINNCFYIGIPLDILFGLLYLFKTFKNQNLGLILDYPLTINHQLENYYQKIGIDYPFKMEFSNCEILWSFQKIFYPSYFDFELAKKMKDTSIDFITIPIGIELSNGSHANILFIDKQNKTIERFEPNGANHPVGLNYNPNLLDNLLESKFIEYNLNFLKPSDFLPTIGFQILENVEAKCKKLGDPNGYCALWCTWWVYHRLKNPTVNNKELAVGLIQTIKMENKSFRNLIRNFSYNIVKYRDEVLKKFDVDINDWMVNEVTSKQIDSIEKVILHNIT